MKIRNPKTGDVSEIVGSIDTSGRGIIQEKDGNTKVVQPIHLTGKNGKPIED